MAITRDGMEHLENTKQLIVSPQYSVCSEFNKHYTVLASAPT